MPRTTKYSEKMQCVKMPICIWDEDLKLKYIPPKRENGILTFQIIEDMVNEALATGEIQNPYFDSFVDVKEVPYGRYNSDPNYRGG